MKKRKLGERKTKSWFFETAVKQIIFSLGITEKKERTQHCHQKRRGQLFWSCDIKRITKRYCEQLCARPPDNPDEMGQFTERPSAEI